MEDAAATYQPHAEWTEVALGEDVSVSALRSGAYVVDLSRRYGQAGIGQASGRLTLERNPHYEPLKARGLRSDPGAYTSLARDPQVSDALHRPISAVSGAGLRLDPATLPEWLQGDAEAQRIADLQYEVCARHLHAWTQPGRDDGGMHQLLFELQWTALVYGFAWFELLADAEVWDLGVYDRRPSLTGSLEKVRVGSAPRRVLRFTLPEWRAPWTVRRWISQREKLIGLEADFSHVHEYYGDTGDARVIFPAEKILLTSHRRLGSNFEGESILRSVGEHIKGIRTLLTAELLGVQIAALGETHVIMPPEGFNDDDRTRAQNYFDNRASDIGKGTYWPHGTQIQNVSPQDEIPDVSSHEDRYRRLIGLALSSEDALIALSQAGSYAAREDASAEARAGYEAHFTDLVGRPLEKLLARIVAANFPDAWARGWRFTPSVTPGALADRTATETLEPVKLAREAGVFTPRPVDEVWARDLLGAPPKPEEDTPSTADQTAYIQDPVERLQQARLALPSGIFHLPGSSEVFRPVVGLPPLAPGEAEAFWATKAVSSPTDETPATTSAPVEMGEGKYAHIDFTPPKGAREAARRALLVRAEKPASERGMTPVGLARARDLSNGVRLSPDTVRRMRAYFDRHQGDKDGTTWEDQGKGWQAWNGWGGDAGYRWARKVVAQMDAADDGGGGGGGGGDA